MTITEFAKSRNQQPQTISRYISRHSEFEGHTKKIGKAVALDEVALRLLEEVYPLPQPVIIGISKEEYLEAMAEKNAKIEKLQELLIRAKDEYNNILLENSDLKADRLLLEDKEKQLKEKDEALSRERERADQERSRADELHKELEKERSKTWWQKLRGK